MAKGNKKIVVSLQDQAKQALGLFKNLDHQTPKKELLSGIESLRSINEKLSVSNNMLASDADELLALKKELTEMIRRLKTAIKEKEAAERDAQALLNTVNDLNVKANETGVANSQSTVPPQTTPLPPAAQVEAGASNAIKTSKPTAKAKSRVIKTLPDKKIPKLPIGPDERRWVAMPEEMKDRPTNIDMGTSLSQVKTKTHTLQAEQFEGGVQNHKIREAIAKELAKTLGKPEKSSLSEAQYFATANGRQIRVANHGESYHFEDSGLNIVPGNVKASHLPIPPGSWVDPKAVAKLAVEENGKLAQLDIDGFNKRMELRKKDSDWHHKKVEHRNSVLPEMLKKTSLADLRSQHKSLGLPVSGVGYKTKVNYATRIIDHLFEQENPRPLTPDQLKSEQAENRAAVPVNSEEKKTSTTATSAAPPSKPPAQPPLVAAAGEPEDDKVRNRRRALSRHAINADRSVADAQRLLKFDEKEEVASTAVQQEATLSTEPTPEKHRQTKKSAIGKKSKTISVYHGTKEPLSSFEDGKQKSGYYPSFYTTTDKERAGTHGENVYQGKIDPSKFFEMDSDKGSEKLKKEAAKAGYETSEGSGFPESKYLESQGFQGIKRGNEYIVFDPKKTFGEHGNMKLASGKPLKTTKPKQPPASSGDSGKKPPTLPIVMDRPGDDPEENKPELTAEQRKQIQEAVIRKIPGATKGKHRGAIGDHFNVNPGDDFRIEHGGKETSTKASKAALQRIVDVATKEVLSHVQQESVVVAEEAIESSLQNPAGKAKQSRAKKVVTAPVADIKSAERAVDVSQKTKSAPIIAAADIKQADVAVDSLTDSLNAAIAAKTELETNLTGVFKRAMQSAVGDIGKLELATKKAGKALNETAQETVAPVVEKPARIAKTIKEKQSDFMKSTKDVLGIQDEILGPPLPPSEKFKQPTQKEIAEAKKRVPPVYQVGNGGPTLQSFVKRYPEFDNVDKLRQPLSSASEEVAKSVFEAKNDTRPIWERIPERKMSVPLPADMAIFKAQEAAFALAAQRDAEAAAQQAKADHYAAVAKHKTEQKERKNRIRREKSLLFGGKEIVPPAPLPSELPDDHFLRRPLSAASLPVHYAIQEASRHAPPPPSMKGSGSISIEELKAVHAAEQKEKAKKKLWLEGDDIDSEVGDYKSSFELPKRLQRQLRSSGRSIRRDTSEVNFGIERQAVRDSSEAAIKDRGKRFPVTHNYLSKYVTEIRQQMEQLERDGADAIQVQRMMRAAMEGLAKGLSFNQIRDTANQLREKFAVYGQGGGRVDSLIANIDTDVSGMIRGLMGEMGRFAEPIQDLLDPNSPNGVMYQIRGELEDAISAKARTSFGKFNAQFSQTALARDLYSRVDMRGLYGQSAIDEGERFRRERLESLGRMSGLEHREARQFGASGNQAMLVRGISEINNLDEGPGPENLRQAMARLNVQISDRRTALNQPQNAGIFTQLEREIEHFSNAIAQMRLAETALGKLEQQTSRYSDPLTQSRNQFRNMEQELYKRLSGSIGGMNQLGARDYMNVFDRVIQESQQTNATRQTRLDLNRFRATNPAGNQANEFIRSTSANGLLNNPRLRSLLSRSGTLQQIEEQLVGEESRLMRSIILRRESIEAGIAAGRNVTAEEAALARREAQLAEVTRLQTTARLAQQNLTAGERASEGAAIAETAGDIRNNQLDRPAMDMALRQVDEAKVQQRRYKEIGNMARAGSAWNPINLINRVRGEWGVGQANQRQERAETRIAHLQGRRTGREPRNLQYAIPQLMYGIEDFMQVTAAGQSPLRAFLGAANNIGPALAILGVHGAAASLAVTGMLGVVTLFGKEGPKAKKVTDDWAESLKLLAISMQAVGKMQADMANSNAKMRSGGFSDMEIQKLSELSQIKDTFSAGQRLQRSKLGGVDYMSRDAERREGTASFMARNTAQIGTDAFEDIYSWFRKPEDRHERTLEERYAPRTYEQVLKNVDYASENKRRNQVNSDFQKNWKKENPEPFWFDSDKWDDWEWRRRKAMNKGLVKTGAETADRRLLDEEVEAQQKPAYVEAHKAMLQTIAESAADKDVATRLANQVNQRASQIKSGMQAAKEIEGKYGLHGMQSDFIIKNAQALPAATQKRIEAEKALEEFNKTVKTDSYRKAEAAVANDQKRIQAIRDAGYVPKNMEGDFTDSKSGQVMSAEGAVQLILERNKQDRMQVEDVENKEKTITIVIDAYKKFEKEMQDLGDAALDAALKFSSAQSKYNSFNEIAKREARGGRADGKLYAGVTGREMNVRDQLANIDEAMNLAIEEAKARNPGDDQKSRIQRETAIGNIKTKFKRQKDQVEDSRFGFEFGDERSLETKMKQLESAKDNQVIKAKGRNQGDDEAVRSILASFSEQMKQLVQSGAILQAKQTLNEFAAGLATAQLTIEGIVNARGGASEEETRILAIRSQMKGLGFEVVSLTDRMTDLDDREKQVIDLIDKNVKDPVQNAKLKGIAREQSEFARQTEEWNSPLQQSVRGNRGGYLENRMYGNLTGKQRNADDAVRSIDDALTQKVREINASVKIDGKDKAFAIANEIQKSNREKDAARQQGQEFQFSELTVLSRQLDQLSKEANEAVGKAATPETKATIRAQESQQRIQLLQGDAVNQAKQALNEFSMSLLTGTHSIENVIQANKTHVNKMADADAAALATKAWLKGLGFEVVSLTDRMKSLDEREAKSLQEIGNRVTDPAEKARLEDKVRKQTAFEKMQLEENSPLKNAIRANRGGRIETNLYGGRTGRELNAADALKNLDDKLKLDLAEIEKDFSDNADGLAEAKKNRKEQADKERAQIENQGSGFQFDQRSQDRMMKELTASKDAAITQSRVDGGGQEAESAILASFSRQMKSLVDSGVVLQAQQSLNEFSVSVATAQLMIDELVNSRGNMGADEAKLLGTRSELKKMGYEVVSVTDRLKALDDRETDALKLVKENITNDPARKAELEERIKTQTAFDKALEQFNAPIEVSNRENRGGRLETSLYGGRAGRELNAEDAIKSLEEKLALDLKEIKKKFVGDAAGLAVATKNRNEMAQKERAQIADGASAFRFDETAGTARQLTDLKAAADAKAADATNRNAGPEAIAAIRAQEAQQKMTIIQSDAVNQARQSLNDFSMALLTSEERVQKLFKDNNLRGANALPKLDIELLAAKVELKNFGFEIKRLPEQVSELADRLAKANEVIDKSGLPQAEKNRLKELAQEEADIQKKNMLFNDVTAASRREARGGYSDKYRYDTTTGGKKIGQVLNFEAQLKTMREEENQKQKENREGPDKGAAIKEMEAAFQRRVANLMEQSFDLSRQSSIKLMQPAEMWRSIQESLVEDPSLKIEQSQLEQLKLIHKALMTGNTKDLPPDVKTMFNNIQRGEPLTPGEPKIPGKAQGGIVDARDTINVKARPGEGIFTPDQMQRMASRMGVSVNEMLSDAKVPGFAQGGFVPQWPWNNRPDPNRNPAIIKSRAEARKEMLSSLVEARQQYFASLRDQKTKRGEAAAQKIADARTARAERQEFLASRDAAAEGMGFKKKPNEQEQFKALRDEVAAGMGFKVKPKTVGDDSVLSEKALAIKKRIEARKLQEATNPKPKFNLQDALDKNRAMRDLFGEGSLGTDSPTVDHRDPRFHRSANTRVTRRNAHFGVSQGDVFSLSRGGPAPSQKDSLIKSKLAANESSRQEIEKRLQAIRDTKRHMRGESRVPESGRYQTRLDKDRIEAEEKRVKLSLDKKAKEAKLQQSVIEKRNMNTSPVMRNDIASVKTPKISSSVAQNVSNGHSEKLLRQQIEKLSLIANHTGAANSISVNQHGAFLS